MDKIDNGITIILANTLECTEIAYTRRRVCKRNIIIYYFAIFVDVIIKIPLQIQRFETSIIYVF